MKKKTSKHQQLISKARQSICFEAVRIILFLTTMMVSLVLPLFIEVNPYVEMVSLVILAVFLCAGECSKSENEKIKIVKCSVQPYTRLPKLKGMFFIELYQEYYDDILYETYEFVPEQYVDGYKNGVYVKVNGYLVKK